MKEETLWSMQQEGVVKKLLLPSEKCVGYLVESRMLGVFDSDTFICLRECNINIIEMAAKERERIVLSSGNKV